MSSVTKIQAGRFAPTPSGPLHFGSLVTALASYCHARAHNANWLLRIEDIDTPRVIKSSIKEILDTLEAFGFEWDGEVLMQSQRFDAYQTALQQLQTRGKIYPCHCSRRQIHSHSRHLGPLGHVYPASCRHLRLSAHDASLRLNVEDAGVIEFDDLHYQHQAIDLPQQIGDIVLRRRDGIYAYHLAVVIDDNNQGITQIVRGADLLYSTAIHLYLNRLLDLPKADYLHIPLVKNAQGEKLGKQTGAVALDRRQSQRLLIRALEFLGQPSPDGLEGESVQFILEFAIDHWDATLIPG